MNWITKNEFLFQLLALVVIIIVVHGFYVGLIRPNAEAHIVAQLALQAAGQDYVPSRSLSVVMRDYEQEACLILLLWALSIMAYKWRHTTIERALAQGTVLNIPEGMSVLPSDARSISRSIEALPVEQQDFLLPRTLASALQRFATTQSIPAVADTVREHCETEADRLDSELSMIRYIAWAIPSIGFIGTVRGIGDALGQAYKAVEGDISGVTVSLGVAFNSTFVALVLSIIIMFCLHQLQQSQERLVLECQRYTDKNLLRFLVTP